jgi:hypothetical protein
MCEWEIIQGCKRPDHLQASRHQAPTHVCVSNESKLSHMRFQKTRDNVTRVDISPFQPEQRYNTPAASSDELSPVGGGGPFSRRKTVIFASSSATFHQQLRLLYCLCTLSARQCSRWNAQLWSECAQAYRTNGSDPLRWWCKDMSVLYQHMYS